MSGNNNHERRAIRREQAAQRQALRDNRTDQEQLNLIGQRTNGQGRGKEVNRLIARIN